MKFNQVAKLALSFAAASVIMTGCGDSSSSSNSSEANSGSTLSPYERVAVIPGKTWDDVPSIANKVAEYVVNTNEADALGYPSNWVIAGANPGAGETYETSDLLAIPVGANKSRVVEFCNGAYATMATNTGRFHGPALPCEASVHSDGTNVYIDMLNPEAIFSIFFSDLTEEEKASLGSVAAAVKSELRGMITTALSDETTQTTTGSLTYTVSTDALGPKYDSDDLSAIAMQSPYLVYKYQNGSTFKKGVDDKLLAQEIITALGTDAATADKTPGLEGLSAGSAWRTARPEPLAIPGVMVTEACSPKYAKMATALGAEYLTALPCEIAVYVDETDETNQTLAVSFLNPAFMFGTMFQGAVDAAYASGQLTQDEVVTYSTLPEIVFGDLRMIADHAIQNSSLGLTIK